LIASSHSDIRNKEMKIKRIKESVSLLAIFC